MAAPLVSVVVPTAGADRPLAECLAALLAQTLPATDYEILVVHNGPGAAPDAPSGGAEVSVLSLPTRDTNAARNAGVERARGELVCLVDDDVAPPPGWLAAVVAGARRHPGADCVGGPVRPVYTVPPPRSCREHELPGSRLDEGPRDRAVGEVWGCNMAIRRSAHARVGPFREGLPYSQEWEWQQRLLAGGGQIVYLADAWLWHRRLADDLRLRALLWQHAQRGYLTRRLRLVGNRQVSVGGLAASLAHAASRGCATGLVHAAHHAGGLWADATGGRRPARPPGASTSR
jgi:glycosyltransferase involved in cell wall biosynthesis